MAEYYPLLAKAVAGLPSSTPEMRRAVYDRAHKALLAQLRNLDPPIAESDVARETEALANAVARLEKELTNVNGHASDRPQAASQIAPSAAFAPPRGGDETKGAGQTKGPSRPSPSFPPPPRITLHPPRRGEPGLGQNAQPKATPPSPKPALGLSTSAPTLPGTMAKPGPFGPPASGQREAKPPERSSLATERLPSAPPADKDDDQDRQSLGIDEDEAPDESFADLEQHRVEGMRLYAPQPDSDESRSTFRLWMVGGIVAVVVAIVAIAAWTLRDRPDELEKLKAPVVADADKTGKIVERVGGGAPDDQSASAAAPAASMAANSATADANAAVKPSDSGQAVPIAYRAAILVEAPEEPSKVKTYVGTVVWRLDNVSGGPGQPLGTAVHADIDIPSDHLKIGLTLQKNTDPSLPASHTVTIDFTVQPGSATGGVKQINVPQLRQDDAPKGDSLIGVPVPIMENSFLVGLSRGTAEATNLQLLKQRAWIDIPILLGNGKIAKLTFEKGASGSRAIDDAISAWQTQ